MKKNLAKKTEKIFDLFFRNFCKAAALKMIFSLIMILFAFIPFSFANNLAISNVKIVNWDTSADTAKVQFDISWSNSWRDATNYDAVWIFVKFSTDAGVTWAHATLKTSGTTPTGFSTGSQSTSAEIIVPSDKKGCFFQRATNDTGSFSSTSVRMVWDYGTNGVSDAQIVDSTNTKVKVFGIEMVYIPTASFVAGDSWGGYCQFTNGTAQMTPYGWNITSGGNLYTGDCANNCNYYYSCGSANEDVSGAVFTIPADFPKGYSAFYLMKYEISQGQYRDFLNTLTRAQQNNRTAVQSVNYFAMSNNTSVVYRQGVRNPNVIPGSPNTITFGCDYNANRTFNESTDGEWIAMNYLSWLDVAAYADWAALRPMTELEFEKACRGTGSVVFGGEYAWGETEASITSDTTGLYDDETYSETPDQGNINRQESSPDGPFRVGSFATGTDRHDAGAGYYGNMELSGNVWEFSVTVGNSFGRNFTGTAGDGALSTNGYATNSDWPGYASGEITDGLGSGLRGGSFSGGTYLGFVSRAGGSATQNQGSSRYESTGGRCARTA